MREKKAEIIELLERADELFKTFDPCREEARTLWNEGIERLAAAIWVFETGEDKKNKTS